MKKILIGLCLLVLVSFAFLFPVKTIFAVSAPTASPIILEQFTGQVIITFPDGRKVTLEPGLPVPEIPSGSTIEVISGTAVIGVLGAKIALEPGSAVKLEADEARGTFRVKTLKGKSELFLGLLKATMDAGDDVLVRFNRRTLRAELVVLVGTVDIEEEGKRRTLSKNQSVRTVLPEFPKPELPKQEPLEPEPIEASPYSL
ncbi:MAG: hypothetical protein NTY10_01035 [Candidatus Omnitrophica bacterium]|nr:hypothetical protein [Candidatus Omnitrophota bacterium]